MPTYDVCILGGGASGLAAAICAAQAGARVCVIEQDVYAGLPLLATGNGRCNISNTSLDVAHYRHPEVVSTIFGANPEAQIESFFNNLGLMFVQEDEGRLYPITRRAESVRDVLLSACKRLGVEILTNSRLVSALSSSFKEDCKQTGAWTLGISSPTSPLHYKTARSFKDDVRAARKAAQVATYKTREINAKSIVVACGGASEDLCDLLHIEHVDESPVLCPLACRMTYKDAHQNNALDKLDGLRVEADLSLERDGTVVAQECGEVLFRAYGISGIAVFNLSRHARPGDTIALNLFTSLSADELEKLLYARVEAIGSFTGDSSWFDGLLTRQLSEVVCSLVDPSDIGIPSLAKLLHRLELEVEGTTMHEQAQVMQGGIPFSSVDVETLAVAKGAQPGLFACGETLDMDADCGGFNLAWAWLSGMQAGTAAAQYAMQHQAQAAQPSFTSCTSGKQ